MIQHHNYLFRLHFTKLRREISLAPISPTTGRFSINAIAVNSIYPVLLTIADICTNSLIPAHSSPYPVIPSIEYVPGSPIRITLALDPSANFTHRRTLVILSLMGEIR